MIKMRDMRLDIMQKHLQVFWLNLQIKFNLFAHWKQVVFFCHLSVSRWIPNCPCIILSLRNWLNFVDFSPIECTGPRFATNYPPPPTVGFMNPSILATGGTLRRPRVEYDTATPRILSKIDIEPQFYYGWPLLHTKMLASPSTVSETAGPGNTSSPKNSNTIAMQNMERTATPTLSLSTSPTSTLTKKPKNPSSSSASDEHGNKNTVVLCPPSRTYCF